MSTAPVAKLPEARRSGIIRAGEWQPAVIAGSVVTVLAGAVGFSTPLQYVALVVGSTGGLLAVRSSRERADRARLRSVDRDVAAAASLLAVTVRAGLGVDAALELVAAQLNGPLGAELELCCRQLRAGASRAAALDGLRERAPSDDVRRLVQALRQTEELGGSVYVTLNGLAEDCRSRRTQLARADAARLPVKILFPVVFLIFPPMLALLIGPALAGIRSSGW